MNKSEFTIGELTFYYIADQKHVDIFIAGISNAQVRGIMTEKEFQQVCTGFQRINEKIV